MRLRRTRHNRLRDLRAFCSNSFSGMMLNFYESIMNTQSTHLTYCLNVHPGETWAENLVAIQTHTLAIRDQVSPGKPFGLGLRLSQQAAATLNQPEMLAAFKTYMAEQNLYAFTINGFPYGAFHTKPVKTAVYHPDWSTPERLNYTTTLAHILAELLPEGTDGSISTLPLGYKFSSGSEIAGGPSDEMVIQLAECALSLHRLHSQTGKEVHIGLEPEPDCLLETTEEVIQFFEKQLIPRAVPHLVARLSCTRSEAESIVRRHIGVCFDTCHLALQFEDLAGSLTRLAQHGIRISKIQLSSALEVIPTPSSRERLKAFLDPVYLHQVKALQGSRHADLDQALASPATPENPNSLWRIHFHVPLYFEGDPLLRSTSGVMEARFWGQIDSLPSPHLEIETYTFHVLPPALQTGGVVASTVREFEWVTRNFLA